MRRTLIAPELETFPNRHRWKVEECYRLADLGFLEGKYELIDGEIVEKMGQKPPHRMAVVLLMEWLISLFGARFVQAESPIAVPGRDQLYSEPEPDLAVTREPTTAYSDRHPGPADVLLVVEVSDTTVKADLLVKAKLYARASIAEYWVLDLNTRQLHVHRAPSAGDYSDITVVGEAGTVSPLSRPEAFITVADLLPPIEE